MDAYFAGLCKQEDYQYPVCVKSSNGYVITLGGCPLHWVSNLKTDISLSNLEAEYIYLYQAINDLLPLRRLPQEVGTQLKMKVLSPATIH